MPFLRKTENPIDRAKADLDRRIGELERRQHQFSDTRPPAVRNAVRAWFTPPSRCPATPSRRDVFEVRADPLKELESDRFPFGREPDLFQQSQPSSEKSDGKLARYLQAGSDKPFRPLKHVQQKNRRKFYLWVGFSIVVVALLVLVVR